MLSQNKDSLGWPVIFFFILSLLGGISFGGILFSVETGERVQKLKRYQPTLPTRLYDINGRLISELFLHKRELAHLKDIPKPVKIAFLSIEDVNFYEHFGIDFVGVLRAFWENIKALDIVQGGSTLTQQLVKSLYTQSERTLSRKIFEAVLALQVEREFSKDEILEMYLNQIYLGHGSYGVSSAAKFYFNKNIQELTLMEGIILASLPKAPHHYSPFKNPRRAISKSKVVLNRLIELGYLSKQESELLHERFWKAYWSTILVTPSTKTSYSTKKDEAPYFTEFVRQILEKKFSKEKLYSHGLQIYTTLDLELQKTGEDVLLKGIKKAEPITRQSNQLFGKGVDHSLLNAYHLLKSILPLPNITEISSPRNKLRKSLKENLVDSLELISMSLPALLVNLEARKLYHSAIDKLTNLEVQGAMIAMEQHTGRILGMIGGKEFKASDQFNRAILAKRQPGSAFKPFVYGAALEDRAIHSNMGFMDLPLININPDGSAWAPVNYGGKYRGYVNLTRALALSMNLISIQVLDRVGPEKVIDFSSRLMKIPPTRFHASPSLALGSSEVTPLELIQGYAIIANDGKDIIPHAILYVTDQAGDILYHPEKEVFDIINEKKEKNKLQVIEQGVAFILNKMMRSVLNGTAHSGVRVVGGFTGDAAGKTGTTSSWSDAWFAGFTSDMIAVFWMGMDRSLLTLGRHRSGATVAAPLWGEFMRKVYQKRGKIPEPLNDETPEGVETSVVTMHSGKWRNPVCEEKMIPTLIPSPITVGGTVKKVWREISDCQVVHTKSFLELMQEQNKISDDEIGKRKKFKKQFQVNE